MWEIVWWEDNRCVCARVCVCVCVCMCVCVRFSTLGFMLESPRELKIFFSWAATSRDSDLIASWWTGGGGLLFALPRQLWDAARIENLLGGSFHVSSYRFLKFHSLGKHFSWFIFFFLIFFTNTNPLLALEPGRSSFPLSIAATLVIFTMISGVTCTALGHKKWQQLPSMGKYASLFLANHESWPRFKHDTLGSAIRSSLFSTLTKGSCLVSQ